MSGIIKVELKSHRDVDFGLIVMHSECTWCELVCVYKHIRIVKHLRACAVEISFLWYNFMQTVYVIIFLNIQNPQFKSVILVGVHREIKS